MGGHEYNDEDEVNNLRYFLNALMTPVNLPERCGWPVELGVDITDRLVG